MPPFLVLNTVSPLKLSRIQRGNCGTHSGTNVHPLFKKSRVIRIIPPKKNHRSLSQVILDFIQLAMNTNQYVKVLSYYTVLQSEFHENQSWYTEKLCLTCPCQKKKKKKLIPHPPKEKILDFIIGVCEGKATLQFITAEHHGWRILQFWLILILVYSVYDVITELCRQMVGISIIQKMT